MISRLRKFGVQGLAGDTLVNGMADAITQKEGTIAPNAKYPQGSLAYQNNNPGNLRFVRNGYNYPGASQGVGGFARYPDVATGRAALEHQIQVQINAGQNLTQFFNQYAPSFENDTPGYIAFVAGQVGVDPSIPLKNYQNGSASIGTFDPSSIPSIPSIPSSPNDVTDSFQQPTSDDPSFISFISDMDPVIVGGTVVVGLGLLYVLYGS